MSVVSIVVAICAFVLAALWAVVGVLGLRGALGRNRWFGVRADSTMRSADAFRVANRVAAPGTLGAAVILAAGGILTLVVDSGWSIVFGLAALFAGVVLVGAVSGYAVHAADSVPDPGGDDGCGCCSGDDHGGVAGTGIDPAGIDHAAGTSRADSQAPTPASDCGTDSCASCTLRGICSADDAPSGLERRTQA